MKKIFFILFAIPFITYAQVGIGTVTPDESSSLDIVSTDKGVLIPRMTVADRIAIATPAEGLLVYQNNDVKGFYFWDGSKWNRMLDKSKDGNPIGTIISFATSNVPANYLECNGAAVSRTTYAALFTIIGVNYGVGDGTTTFNLPDYRGQFLRGYDHGAANDPNAAIRSDRGDGTTGDQVGTVQSFSNSAHFHNHNSINATSNATGNHRHLNSGGTGVVNNAASHNHGVPSLNRTTNTVSNHNHAFRLVKQTINYNGGSNTANLVSHIYNSGIPNAGTTYNGTHNHTVNIPARNTHFAGSHAHSVSLNNFYSQYGGTHNHTFSTGSFNSQATGGSESRPKNITVMYCIKY